MAPAAISIVFNNHAMKRKRLFGIVLSKLYFFTRYAMLTFLGDAMHFVSSSALFFVDHGQCIRRYTWFSANTQFLC